LSSISGAWTKGVVADTITPHPRIEEREGENENQAQEEL
jgi:hypothetical protein